MNEILSAKNVSVRLGGRVANSGITFSTNRGDLVAILGPNGSGKSTFIRALVGLLPITEGVIEVLGNPPGKCKAGRIGYVPQIKSLDRTFPALAVELVASARRGTWPGALSAADHAWSASALERVGAGHLAGRQVSRLSGGELQRVYLAKAMAQGVELLILDEPESGIDAAGTSDLYGQLDTFRAETGGAVILVTHDWDAAIHHASHVLLLNGRQVSFGSPAEALSEESVRAAFGHVGHAHGVQSASHQGHDHGDRP
jgi:zinc transport system ATP-binding protein